MNLNECIQTQALIQSAQSLSIPRDMIQIILEYLFFDSVHSRIIINLEYRQWSRLLCIDSKERKKWHIWAEAMHYEHLSYMDKSQESETIEVYKCTGCREWVNILNTYQVTEHRCCIDDLGNPMCGDSFKTCQNCDTILPHGGDAQHSGAPHSQTVKKRNAMLFLKQLNDDTRHCLKECNLSRRAILRRKRRQAQRKLEDGAYDFSG